MALSTHVLDIARGVPGIGIDVALFSLGDDGVSEIARETTDADGRIVAPFGGPLAPGLYELRFYVDEYFEELELISMYDEIPVRFTIHDESRHYHIPLLLAPWGYSTYRGG
jgi:5-hydroxyisourate hydrolase